MSTTGGQHSAVFEEIFTNDRRIVGDALLAARLTLLANTAASYQQISDTFLLFGDPATSLKLPVPRRPQGISVSRTAEGDNLVRWDESADCDGYPVEGYNIYRRAADDSAYNRLNNGPVTSESYSDTTAEAASLYYYAVTSLDADGYESARSVAVTAATSSGSSGGGAAAVGCFVQSASGSVSFARLWRFWPCLSRWQQLCAWVGQTPGA